VIVLFVANAARDTGRAMSQENVDVAQRGLDAFNRRDKAAWLALNAPEIEVVPPRDWPESDPIRGCEAVWGFYVGNIQAFRDGSLEHVEVIDAGNDKVVTHMRGAMHGKASGASVAFNYWPVSTFRDGKTLRTEWFANRADALEAVGLRK
jgi:ketosteroid isomerase-like protein